MNDHRQAAWAYNRLRHASQSDIAAARTREVLDGLRYVAALLSAGVVLAFILWFMRAM